MPKMRFPRGYCAGWTDGDIRATLLFYRRLLKKGVFFRPEFAGNTDDVQLGSCCDDIEASSRGYKASMRRTEPEAPDQISDDLTTLLSMGRNDSRSPKAYPKSTLT